LRSKVDVFYKVTNPDNLKKIKSVNMNWTRIDKERAFFLTLKAIRLKQSIYHKSTIHIKTILHCHRMFFKNY